MVRLYSALADFDGRKEAYAVTGAVSDGPAKTHIDIEAHSLADILRLLNQIQTIQAANCG
jgi:hypothetical protein